MRSGILELVFAGAAIIALCCLGCGDDRYEFGGAAGRWLATLQMQGEPLTGEMDLDETADGDVTGLLSVAQPDYAPSVGKLVGTYIGGTLHMSLQFTDAIPMHVLGTVTGTRFDGHVVERDSYSLKAVRQ